MDKEARRLKLKDAVYEYEDVEDFWEDMDVVREYADSLPESNVYKAKWNDLYMAFVHLMW